MDTPSIFNKKRLKYAMWIMFFLFALLIVRLFVIMVVQNEELERRAMSQQTKNTTLSATRGRILDSTGIVLARNATAYKVVIWPNNINDLERQRVSKELARLLNMDYASVLEKVSNTKKQEIVLARQVEREIVDEIEGMKLGIGVGTAIDTKRYYSSGALYSQLLGFTTVDGEGQAGLEQKYDKYLAGKDGRMVSETDRDRNPLPYGMQDVIEATDGYDIILTTDAIMQSALEKACAEALEVNNANNVQGIIMDCTTGEIKALTAQPDFDPNAPPRKDMALLSSLMRNRVAADAFEPGTPFGLITLAAAIDSGAADENSLFNCDGKLDVNGQRLRCTKSGGHGAQTLFKAVQNGCGLGFADLALKMGAETFYDYIYSFGFGTSTASGLTGETAGAVTHQKYITDDVLAKMGFGQSITATPLQLATAISAAVNGGTLMKPYYIDSVVAQDGTVIEQNNPTVVRRVISKESSALLREIGESAAAQGSGKNAAVPGYRVGGTAGAAEKHEDDGAVKYGSLSASYVGFAPANDPKYVCIILLDEPRVGKNLGNKAAAPFIKQVLEEVLRYEGYLPVASDVPAIVPDIVGLTVAQAKDVLKDMGFGVAYQDGENDIVTAQAPLAGRTAQAGSEVLLYTAMTSFDVEGATEGGDMTIVPDVLNRTRLEAHDALKEAGLTIRIDPPDQSGTAIRQSPAAGEQAQRGTAVLVEFSNTGIGE